MSKCSEGRKCNMCGPAVGAAHRDEKRCAQDFEDEDWSDFDSVEDDWSFDDGTSVSGWDPFEDEITGEHDLFAEDAWPAEHGEACPECNGSGYLVYDSEQDESECPVCRGTGYLSLLP